MKVIIPAAGLGKRFVAAGVTTPKELLPLGGKPLIAHALSEAAAAGFDSATVVVSPAKESLRRYLRENQHPIPVEVTIQTEPRGIGDAVLGSWEDETVGVLLPDDVVVTTDHWKQLLRLFLESGAAAVCVRPVPLESIGRFGIAECQGDRVERLVEKPAAGTTQSNLAVFGRYLVTESVVAGLRASDPRAELELTYGFAAAAAADPGVRAAMFGGQAYDCGIPDAYARAIASFPSSAPRDLASFSGAS